MPKQPLATTVKKQRQERLQQLADLPQINRAESQRARIKHLLNHVIAQQQRAEQMRQTLETQKFQTEQQLAQLCEAKKAIDVRVSAYRETLNCFAVDEIHARGVEIELTQRMFVNNGDFVALLEEMADHPPDLPLVTGH